MIVGMRGGRGFMLMKRSIQRKVCHVRKDIITQQVRSGDELSDKLRIR